MYCLYKNQRTIKKVGTEVANGNDNINVVVIERFFILFNVLNLAKGYLILNKS